VADGIEKRWVAVMLARGLSLVGKDPVSRSYILLESKHTVSGSNEPKYQRTRGTHAKQSGRGRRKLSNAQACKRLAPGSGMVTFDVIGWAGLRAREHCPLNIILTWITYSARSFDLWANSRHDSPFAK
jgi:hypothetical protein